MSQTHIQGKKFFILNFLRLSVPLHTSLIENSNMLFIWFGQCSKTDQELRGILFAVVQTPCETSDFFDLLDHWEKDEYESTRDVKQ